MSHVVCSVVLAWHFADVCAPAPSCCYVAMLVSHRYEIFLNSESGPIEVFLVSQVAYAQSDEPGRVASPARPASPHLAIGSAAGLAEEAAVTGKTPPVPVVAGPYSRGYVHERSAYHDAATHPPTVGSSVGALGSDPPPSALNGPVGVGGISVGQSDSLPFHNDMHAFEPAGGGGAGGGGGDGTSTQIDMRSFTSPSQFPVPAPAEQEAFADLALPDAASVTHSLDGRRELGGLLPLYPEVDLEDELPPFAVQLGPGVGISDMFDELPSPDLHLPDVSGTKHRSPRPGSAASGSQLVYRDSPPQVADVPSQQGVLVPQAKSAANRAAPMPQVVVKPEPSSATPAKRRMAPPAQAAPRSSKRRRGARR